MVRVSVPAHLALVAALVLCAAAAPATSPQRGTPPPTGAAPAPRGAISGTVVDGVTNRPIGGAVVTSGASIDQQITDAAGRFLFIGLPASSYQLRAVRPGYFDGAVGAETWDGLPRAIALGDGQWVPDATIKLWRPSALGGTVVDEIGEAIVGVYVSVVPRILIAGEPQLVGGPMTKTDDLGRYRVGMLTPGGYGVLVHSIQVAVPAGTTLAERSNTTPDQNAQAARSGQDLSLRRDALAVDGSNHLLLGSEYVVPPTPRADGQPQAYPVTYYPSARSAAHATVIDLAPGEERAGVDVQLRPVPVRRVSGTVQALGGADRPRLVRLMPAGDEDMGAGHETAAALVGPNGAFTFVNVPDGSYTILAGPSAAGYSFGHSASQLANPMQFGSVLLASGFRMQSVSGAPRGTYLLTLSNASGGHAGREPVDVAGADRTGVVVRVGGASINGRVEVERREGASAPAFFDVVAEPAGGELALGEGRGRVQMNDPTRAFTIDGLMPGEYLLRVPPTVGILRSITWQGQDYSAKPFLVTTGQALSDVVVTTTRQIARLQGTVRDAQGRPATRGAVICFPADPAGWRRYGVQSTRLRSVAANTAGAYDINGLPGGDYYLLAVDESLAAAWRDAAFLESATIHATHVTLAWGETRAVNLTIAPLRP